MHVRRGDMVQVVQGDDAGKRGRVLRTNRETNRVVVENVNMVYRHMKRSQRVRKEAAIDASTVQIFCESCNKPVRVRSEKDEDGRKHRVCVVDGTRIPDPGTVKSKKK